MSDDLLDKAARLRDRHTAGHRETETSRIVRDLIERVQQADAEAISLRSIVTHETQMREDAESRAAALSETRTRILAKHPHAMCNLNREEAEAERDEYVALRDRWARAASEARAERDEARGKLDAVRALANEEPDNLLDELRTLLAILDGK